MSDTPNVTRLRFAAVTLFPEMFEAITRFGISRRAFETGISTLTAHNPRDFATDRYKTIDDRPFGGGPGMLMMVQPLTDAIRAAKQAAGGDVHTVYLSPQGRKLDQKGVQELARHPKLLLVAGRYEGIDERVLEEIVTDYVSIGDYVLTEIGRAHV